MGESITGVCQITAPGSADPFSLKKSSVTVAVPW